MKQFFIPGLAFLSAAVLLAIGYSSLELPNQARIHDCSGECYEQYVAENGTILEQQRAAAEAAASASPAELGRQAFGACQACHGADGSGGIGPNLVGQSQDFVVEALTAYKNRETRGPQSSVMYATAGGLSETDMKNLGAYVETL